MPDQKRRRAPARLSHLTLAKLVQRLLVGPAAVDALQEWTGLSRDTVYKFMRAMQSERVVHIHDWMRDALGRPSIPIFALGVGVDKPRRAK